MTKCWDVVAESASSFNPETSFNILNIKQEKLSSPKKFIFDTISENEDDLRKSILWDIQDCVFKKSLSRLNSKAYFSFNYKLPKEMNPKKQMAIIVRLEPHGFVGDKYDQDLFFIVLNNEMQVHHKSTGPLVELLKAGDRLHVPPNKRFFLFNKDVDSSHILLLLPPKATLPAFVAY